MVCLSARLALDLSVSWRRCVSVRVVAVMRPEGVCRLHGLSPHFLAFFLPLNSSFWEKKKCEVTKSTDERALEPAGVPLFFSPFSSLLPQLCVCVSVCVCLPPSSRCSEVTLLSFLAPCLFSHLHVSALHTPSLSLFLLACSDAHVCALFLSSR